MSTHNKGPYKFKKPAPLDEKHNCSDHTVLIERIRNKVGPDLLVFSCRQCGEVWEKEAVK